ncbi:MAG: dienelactone hydrolase family protein [Gemmatimonadota bacterium]|nr:MAG: dienelactone hydrolase family protein [Gemmatimonadota bacterium]
MITKRLASLRYLLLACATLLLLPGCGDDSTEPQDRIIEGVDFDVLFAEPSQAEINAISDEWASRDVTAQGDQEESSSALQIGGIDATLRIVSHTVDGVRHYGAILVPDGALPGSLPVLVYTHGGDGGIDIDATLPLLPFILGDDLQNFVFVAPSFRAEPLVFDGTTYSSDGPPSPWDRDVDDALALINVVAATTPEADMSRVGIIGFSRGACVGLLMAERDPTIDIVVEFFGPTDFFGPFVQDVVEEALRGSLRDLPGLEYLNDEYIQPLKNGQLTIADVRPELVRRSPVYFAERLPQLQVHHGTADDVVPVGEARRLNDVMVAMGRGEPEYEYYVYVGGSHDPLSLPGSIDRTSDFISRLLALTFAADGASNR